MSGSQSLRYPDFIGIGAQKAGTTWLHRILRQHPDVWLPPVKELHYFDRLHAANKVAARDGGPTGLDKARKLQALQLIDQTLKSSATIDEKLEKILSISVIGTAQLTDDWYGRIFQAAPEAALCGEITPEYALLPDEGIAHIVRLQPNARLIFIMRDPIDRSWSALRMVEKKGHSECNARRRISRAGFLAYSDYNATIERVLNHLPGSNLLLLYYDDLVERPAQLLQDVLNFLGLDRDRAEFASIGEPVHAGQEKSIDPELYEEIRQLMAPIYQRLLSLNSPIVERWYQRHYATSPYQVGAAGQS